MLVRWVGYREFGVISNIAFVCCESGSGEVYQGGCGQASEFDVDEYHHGAVL